MHALAYLSFMSVAVLLLPPAFAQRVDTLAPPVRKYVSVGTPRVILEHVQVIDGTGAAPIADRNIDIESGKDRSASLPARIETPADGTTILDLRGYSVMPGIVGMHEHLFYIALPNLDARRTASIGPALFLQMSFSAPRLYLANGVTTMRTRGQRRALHGPETERRRSRRARFRARIWTSPAPIWMGRRQSKSPDAPAHRAGRCARRPSPIGRIAA